MGKKKDLQTKVNERMQESVAAVGYVAWQNPLGSAPKQSKCITDQNFEMDMRELEFYEGLYESYGGDKMDLHWNVEAA
jgi:hypothetical protein